MLVEGDDMMDAISITKARANLYQTVAEVNEYSKPITITNNRGKNAVLVSEDDWNAIQETLYLNSISGMTESILESRKESLEECTIYNPEEEWQMYLVRFSKQADKDKKMLKGVGLEKKAKELLNIVANNPFQMPPPYEALLGNLNGFYSRRINIQHRLVYEVYNEAVTYNNIQYEGTVVVARMWTHYDKLR